MSLVFQNIDLPPPPTPLTARRVCTPRFGAGGGHTRCVEKGVGGVNILEDARHSSVLYICKYFASWNDSTLMMAKNVKVP